jgi:hypothetical protein
MNDPEDAYHDGHVAVGKGLIIGVALGSLLWVAIIEGIMHLFR